MDMATDNARLVPSLTGLRGIAAIWVLLFHIHFIAGEYGRQIHFLGEQIVSAGWVGVDMFFILSGFMLMNVHAGQFRSPSLKLLTAFYVSRAVRVYPLSLLTLFGIAAMISVDAPFRHFFAAANPGNLSPTAFIATAALATRWGLPIHGDWNEPIWSLSVEVLGYVIFPALALFVLRMRSRGPAMLVCAAAVLMAPAAEAVAGVLGKNAIHEPAAFIRMASAFSGGILLRRVVTCGGLAERAAPTVSLVAVTVLLILPGFAIGPGLMPLAFVPLIASLFHQRGLINGVLASPAIVALGRISFPLYLLHAMPIMLLDYHLRSGRPVWNATYLFAMGGLCLLLIALAWLLHVAVERPSHRWARAAFRHLDAPAKVAQLGG